MSHESAGRAAEVRVFGPFRLDSAEQRLWKGATALKLSRKPFAILLFLTENPLRLVTQEEVVAAVWGKIAMSESLLRTHMSEVRRVLGEGAIETVVGRGYGNNSLTPAMSLVVERQRYFVGLMGLGVNAQLD